MNSTAACVFQYLVAQQTRIHYALKELSPATTAAPSELFILEKMYEWPAVQQREERGAPSVNVEVLGLCVTGSRDCRRKVAVKTFPPLQVVPLGYTRSGAAACRRVEFRQRLAVSVISSLIR